MPVPSPPACSPGTRQPHPSPALGLAWLRGLRASGVRTVPAPWGDVQSQASTEGSPMWWGGRLETPWAGVPGAPGVA